MWILLTWNKQKIQQEFTQFSNLCISNPCQGYIFSITNWQIKQSLQNAQTINNRHVENKKNVILISQV
jgi:hypothetical protein